ncbi:MAG: hypothetical protein ABFS17_02475 [Chloroflexota bacterium]
MADKQSISGVKQFQLTWQEGRMQVLSEDDHLLRRFGQLDLVRLQPDTRLSTHRQQGADEIWVIVSGAVELTLTDMREESPTNQAKMEFSLLEENYQGVLIPFGVKAELSSSDSGMLLRLATHADQLTPLDLIFDISDEVD